LIKVKIGKVLVFRAEEFGKLIACQKIPACISKKFIAVRTFPFPLAKLDILLG
tara:strand:+ start:280 stop:438 length:159 start_codon:yes stop_codon:yes gene_type:complete